MIRTFNVKEVNYGFVEVDIPEGISEEKVNELVMDKINNGDAVWSKSNTTYEPEINESDVHDNLMLYIPSLDKSIFFHQGIGDNLLHEDIEQGFNDYCMYFLYDGKISIEQYENMVEDWNPEELAYDEGQWMFNNEEITYFLDARILIPHILEMAFDNPDLEYELIGDSGVAIVK